MAVLYKKVVFTLESWWHVPCRRMPQSSM